MINLPTRAKGFLTMFHKMLVKKFENSHAFAPVCLVKRHRHYGPWGQVAHNITEGLVKRGFDVNNFLLRKTR
jgi:hypothetical protein